MRSRRSAPAPERWWVRRSGRRSWRSSGPPERSSREPFALIRGTGWLWVTIAVAGFSNLTLTGLLEADFPLLIRDHLHADVGLLGWMSAALAAGSVLAVIALGSRGRLRRRGWLIYVSWIAAAILTAAFGLPIGPALAVALAFAVGACLATFGLAWTVAIQELVPAHVLGRVSSIDALGSWALIPFGLALCGFAADVLGPSTTYLSFGVISALVIAAGLLNRSVRELD